MAPNPKSKKKRDADEDGRTDADRARDAESKRRRRRADGLLLCDSVNVNGIKASEDLPLRKSDGSDIVKRNAARKKKYLLVFPGAFSVAPGAHIGELTNLDSKNPSLYIEYAPHGRFKLNGSLVFPKNPFFTLKGSQQKAKPVNIVDMFETLVVFSEWAWIGTAESNPGEVPSPIPKELLGSDGSLPLPWLSGAKISKGAVNGTSKSARMQKKAPAQTSNGNVAPHDTELSTSSGNASSDGQEWGDDMALATNSVQTRANPRREGRSTSYKSMFESDEDSADEEESSE